MIIPKIDILKRFSTKSLWKSYKSHRKWCLQKTFARYIFWRCPYKPNSDAQIQKWRFSVSEILVFIIKIIFSFGCPVQPLFWTIENEYEILDTFSCTLTQQGRFKDVFLKQGILKMILRNDFFLTQINWIS